MIKEKINTLVANPYIGFVLYFVFHSFVFGQIDYEILGNTKQETISSSINIGFFLAPLYSAIIAGILFKKKNHTNFENNQLLISSCLFSGLAFLTNFVFLFLLVGEIIIPSFIYTVTFAMLVPFLAMAGLSIGTWCVSEKPGN